MKNVAALVIVAGLAGSASAQLKTWDGDGGNLLWFDGANWDPDGVPQASDRVVVEAGGRVVAESQPVEVVSLEALSGLEIVSSSLTFAGGSRIVGLFTGGCCRPEITHSSTLLIEGSSVLGKSASFRGSGVTTLGGMVLNDEQLYARDAHEVIIAGEMLMTSSGALEPWDSGRIVVEGTVTGVGGSGIGRVVGPAVVVNRGTIQIAEPGLMRFVGSVDTEGAGAVLADRGEIELTGECDFDGGTIEAWNGGTVELLMGAECEVRGATMRGDGEVYVQTGRAVFSGTNTAAMSFPGTMLIRNPLRIGGTLRNTGHMTLFGATLRDEGGSGAFETSGFVDIQVNSRVDIPAAVKAGGTLQPRATLSLTDELTIEPGGQLSFNEVPVEVTVPGGESAQIVNLGQVRIDASLGSYSDRDVLTVRPPFEMRAGGEVKQYGGFLRFEGGGELSGGTFLLLEDGAGMALRGDNLGWAVSGEPVAEGMGDFWLGGGSGRTTIDLAGTFRLNVTGQNNVGSVLRALVRGQGELINEGTALIDDGDSNGFRLESTFRNTGALTIERYFVNAGTIINEGTVEHRFSGGLGFEGGVIRNEGVWTFGLDANSGDYVVSPSGSFINNGTFEAIDEPGSGHSHRIRAAFSNNGAVLAHNARLEFFDCTNLVNGELLGGTWTALDFGSIRFPGETVTSLGPGTRVFGDGLSAPWIEDIAIVEGELTVQGGGASFADNIEVRGGTFRAEADTEVPSIRVTDGGTIEVGEGKDLESTGEVRLHSVLGEIEGVVSQGIIGAPARLRTPLLDLWGRLIPGGESRAGQIDVLGGISCTADAQMLFDIGGDDNTDVLTVTGSVLLAGSTLRVSLIDEFQPVGGESFTLIDAAGGVSGAFGAEDLPILPGDLSWEVAYGQTTVTLSVVGGSCQADWNGDGSVNTQDFLAYLNDWNTQRGMDCSGGGCSADLNGDDVVNTQDFLAFLNLWTVGC